ncbi:hypothetical protein [Rossellomorea marisflavi]|uniref:hypothetical protein n=1 Tax=Rossellomorea marisflavi TaxID=189381 RepID=UPI003F9F53AE
MGNEHIVIGTDFNTLQAGKVELRVDRYAVVDGLGIFFFNGECSDENLVYTALGYENPVLVEIGDSHHYYVKDKEGNFDLYLNLKEIRNRKPSVKEGEHCINKKYVNQISMVIEMMGVEKTKESLFDAIEKPSTPEKFEKKVIILKELYDKSTLMQYSYAGYAKVNSDMKIEWIQSSDVMTYEEAYAYLQELSNLS